MSDLLIKIHDYIYKPTALIADNAPAITNGFKHAFSSYSKRVSCWAHVIRNIDSQLKTIKNEKDSVRHMQHQLQTSEILFNQSIILFQKKWHGIDPQVNIFLEYLEKKWFKKNEGWYEGYCCGIPSHSIAIESTHKHMKAFDILRLAFNQFLNSMETGLIYEWSYERNPEYTNYKQYHDEPVLSTKDWTDAFKWNAKNHKAKKLGKYYYVSNKKVTITLEDCRILIQ